MSGDRRQGRIKWFREDKGYGFIEQDEGEDCFFHSTQLSERVEKGDRVSFRITQGKKGPLATEIRRID